jgi:hypothetical protein
MLADIRNYANPKFFLPILAASSFVDTAGLFVWRYTSPATSPIQKWYNVFGLTAYMIDIFSIMIGVVLTQLVASVVGGAWNPVFFCILAVAIQMTHDLFFGLVVVPFIPKGHNAVMDLMKEYVKIKNPGGILIVDAIYMIIASLLTMVLAGSPAWVSWCLILLVFYVTGYILFTRAR